MNHLPDDMKNLFDEYLEATITPERLQQLEQYLRADETLRASFVRYAQLHTDLLWNLRVERLTEQTLAKLPAPPRASHRYRWYAGTAVALLLTLGLGWWLGQRQAKDTEPVAWVVNAQDCRWTHGESPASLHVGTALELDRGLVEVRFRSGATVLLDGPARLEFLSANSGQVHHGRITARVPEQAIGFELRSPEGRIIDLGTEFGMTVHPDGQSEVYVFEGEIEAYPQGGNKVHLTQAQGASLNKTGLHKADAPNSEYVRTIHAPAPPPTAVVWDFRQPQPNTIRDRTGQGIGLKYRLKGTGKSLLDHDANLFLNPDLGLELTTTNSDLNLQFRLTTGEYFGVKLADYGFTGDEDFEFSADFPHIPALRSIGQFGVYAGTSSSRNIRGGLISKGRGGYRQFLVNNADGEDSDLAVVGLSSTGDDLRVTLRRINGQYSMTAENRTADTSCTLTIKHPDHLDKLKDLHVGIFGANTHSDESKTLVVRQAKLTLWKPTRRPEGR